MSAMVTPTRLGFIGVGNIGKPIAARLAEAGYILQVYDAAGAGDRAPVGAVVAGSAAEAGRNAEIVFLCLPAFEMCEAVVEELLPALGGARLVVDTSTIGPNGAMRLAELLSAAGGSYVDAPVSGGVHRAYEGKLTSMIAGTADAVQRVRPAIAAYSSNLVSVGTRPGQAQAMKLVNNYASIVALLGTSEAISYGMSQGLEMSAMLAVMNVSSGQSFATSTHFPKHIVNGAFDSAAPGRIVGKDLKLFVSEAGKAGTSHSIGAEALATFEAYLPGHLDDDWLRIFEFIRERKA
jgi:3-hydroxyisobutyrate dehydrogenase